VFFFFQAEDGIRDFHVTGVQTCALPISSRFDKRYRYGVFPSVSAGWVVSNEDFLRDNDWLSFLKLRASWGKLGNQNIGSNFPYTSYLSLDKFYLYNGKPVPTAILQQMANDQISWETSTSKNIGRSE